MGKELSKVNDSGLCVLVFCNMVYRGAGDAGGLGPGADDRERFSESRII